MQRESDIRDRERPPFVQIGHLSHEFSSSNSSVIALRDVDLQVHDGEFLAIVGPSGCGKSTLLKLITGLVSPTRGEISIEGQRLSSTYTRAGFVFQTDNLMEWRTILQNVMLPAEIRKLHRTSLKTRAMELLKSVGLAGFEDSFPYQLSGGMRQRAALCRALLCESPLLLMDEPFGALDAITREEHQVLLQDLLAREPRTVVLVTHDIHEAVFLADRVVLMSARPGRIRESIDINMSRPRVALKESTPEFQRYVSAIRHQLFTVDGSEGGE